MRFLLQMFLPLPNGNNLLLVIQAGLSAWPRVNFPWSLKPRRTYHTKTLCRAPDVSPFKLSTDN